MGVQLDGDTDIKGEEVLLEGLIKGPVEVPPLEEEERPLPMPPPEPPPPPEEPEKKGFWDKVLDVVQVGLDVVAVFLSLVQAITYMRIMGSTFRFSRV